MSQITGDQAISRVQHFLRRGDPVAALKMTSEIVRQAPKFGQGQFHHARALLRSGRTAAARRLLDALISVADESARAVLELEKARAFLHEGHPADAVGPAERARDAMPTSRAACAVLAEALALSGRADEAAAILDAAPEPQSEADSSVLEALAARGVTALEGAGDPAAAIGPLKEGAARVGLSVVELLPSLRTLAELHARTGDDDEAFTVFRRAAKMSAPGVDPRPHGEAITGVIDAWTKANSVPSLSADDIVADEATSDRGPRFAMAIGLPGGGGDLVGVLAEAAGGRRIGHSHALLGAAMTTLPGSAAGFARVMPPPVKATRPQLRKVRELALQAAFLDAPDAPAVVDGSWGQVYGLAIVPLVLPDAKVVFVERDEADAAVACMLSEGAPRCPFSNDAAVAAAVNRDLARLIDHHRAQLAAAGVATLTVAYEDLVADSDDARQSVLEFVGVPSDAEALTNATAAMRRVTSRVHAQPGVAKRFESRLRDLRRVLADEG